MRVSPAQARLRGKSSASIYKLQAGCKTHPKFPLASQEKTHCQPAAQPPGTPEILVPTEKSKGSEVCLHGVPALRGVPALPPCITHPPTPMAGCALSAPHSLPEAGVPVNGEGMGHCLCPYIHLQDNKIFAG